MAFISVTEENQAAGDVADLYEADRERLGYVPNYTKAWAHRPAAYRAWRQLIREVSGPMDDRRYELVTLAASRRLRSSYCMLAHGKTLRDEFFAPDVLRDIVLDHRTADLDPVDVAVMDLAEKVVGDATSITDADIAQLRALGLADEEIFDVILASAARAFFSKVNDSVGALPDAVYRELEPELREVLAVGRPIEGS